MYAMLSTLGPNGWETLREKPDRILAVREEVEALGLRVHAQYALMGQYDFLNLIEAPDEQTMAKAAIMLAARGTMRTTTMPAIPVEHMIWQRMRELDLLKRLGCRQGGNPLRRTCWFRWRLVLPTRPPMSDPWTRPALRLAHGIQHAAQVGQLRPSLTWSPKARDWTHPPLESCELHHIIPG